MPSNESTNAAAFSASAYVDAASALIGLPIPAELREGVVQNIERTAQIAAAVLSYPIPEGIESAQVFEP